MKNPLPKTLLGWLYVLFIAPTLLFFIRVLFIVSAQNVENLSTEKGYDKLLSRHWSEIGVWMQDNIFTISICLAFFLGGSISLGLLGFLQKKIPSKTNVSKEDKFSGLQDEIKNVADMLWDGVKSSDDFVNNKTRINVEILYSKMKLLDINPPQISLNNEIDYNVRNYGYLTSIYEYAKQGALKEAKRESRILITQMKREIITSNDHT